MNKKNKFLIILVVPYLLIMGFVFYIFFSPGLIESYEPLNWKGIETTVPGGFTIKEYNARGWEVYSLNKMTALIKIALFPGTNVQGLTAKVNKIKYLYSPTPNRVYYISNPRKTFEAVFALAIPEEHKTIYISVSAPSIYTVTRVLEKIAGNLSYNGKSIGFKQPPIPLKTYWTDLLLLAGMIIPLLLIVILFTISGRKPAQKHFEGDPIATDEEHVYFSHVKKYRRKGSFAYMALTSTRLLVFTFKKKSIEINLLENLPEIKIVGKKIFIQLNAEEKIIVKPSNLEKWKSALTPYLNEPPN